MGPIVVTLIAVAIMLVLAVVVAVVRLLGALRRLRAAVDSTRQWIGPAIAELTEAGQITSLELAQLQASASDLGSGREQVADRHHLSDEAEDSGAASLH
ncbi:hypothetical protein BH23ACT10_BH23ACT10_22370 [soil metagenome]